MTEVGSFTFSVEASGGEKLSYQIRGLKEGEISNWANFCASVFSYKPNPPPAEYFARHYHNDPNRVASLIRVAVINGRIVASCRLFLRTISREATTSNESSTTQILAGGIGEVCTVSDHRRRGLSGVLLRNVIDIMRERRIPVSLLHAAPAFFPVYQKAGFSCTVTQWAVLTIESTANLTSAAQDCASRFDQLVLRKAEFPLDTNQLQHLHASYSERRFSGCIHRSAEYWNRYLSQELDGSIWVAEDVSTRTIVSWLSIRKRGERIQLREYGYNAAAKNIEEDAAFTILLSKAMEVIEMKYSEPWKLVVPSALSLGRQSVSFVARGASSQETDEGWMYKILDTTLNLHEFDGSGIPHLLWPADSF